MGKIEVVSAAAGRFPSRQLTPAETTAWAEKVVREARDSMFVHGAAGDGHVYLIAQDRHDEKVIDAGPVFVRIPMEALTQIVGTMACLGARLKMEPGAPEKNADVFRGPRS